MIRIRLFCANGMSTSLMVKKMKEAAVKQGLEVDIEALADSKLDEATNGIDVALLGPQVRYQLKKAKILCEPKNVPVEVIPIEDYGMMRGDKVLEYALKLMNEK